MISFITTTALGLLICVFGIINMTGNISTLHSYHRKRVTEEDRKPFGKLVGLGTLIIGVATIVFGAMLLAFERTQLDLYAVLGTVLLIAGIVAGMAISFYAMMKYNKGIF
jgi:uncharacterized membrane protein YidH (DUF202 family)